MILAVICNLPVENRLRINLLNPQTTVLTLDLQIVARVTRGGKPVPTSVPRAINQREKYLLFVGHWFLPGGILFRTSCTMVPRARAVQLGLATVLLIIWGRGRLHQRRDPPVLRWGFACIGAAPFLLKGRAVGTVPLFLESAEKGPEGPDPCHSSTGPACDDPRNKPPMWPANLSSQGPPGSLPEASSAPGHRPAGPPLH